MSFLILDPTLLIKGQIHLTITQVSLEVLKQRYLFFIELDEQLSQNTVKYLQLCYFSAIWNLSIVEPFIYSDTEWLSSLPPVSKDHDMLPYFDLYNKTAIAKSLTKCLEPNLAKEKQKEFKFHKIDEALISSPREVLVLRFMRTKWSKEKGWSCGVCDDISSEVKKTALDTLNTRVHEVEERAKEVHGEQYTFQVWRTVCIDAIHFVPFSIDDALSCIQKHLDQKQEQGVSVVIEQWEKVVTYRTNVYYYCPKFIFDDHYCQNNSLPHTPLVLSTVDEMRLMYNLTGNYIGIYARTELLGRKEHDTPGIMLKCFKKLMNKVTNFRRLNNIPLSHVVLLHDAGKYGSKSFSAGISKNKGAMERAKRFLEMFKSNNISTVNFNPEVRKDLPQHRAFVAAVDQEFLSQSYGLMAIGGGGFMRNVKERFAARNGRESHYYYIWYENQYPTLQILGGCFDQQVYIVHMVTSCILKRSQ